MRWFWTNLERNVTWGKSQELSEHYYYQGFNNVRKDVANRIPRVLPLGALVYVVRQELGQAWSKSQFSE